jgi:hypothetical protein
MSDITEYNHETGEIVFRKFNKNEKPPAMVIEGLPDISNFLAEIEAIEAAKASALSKLLSLGLTEEEAKAIAGIK